MRPRGETVTVYKKTFYDLLKSRGVTSVKFSEECGKSSSWISQMFSQIDADGSRLFPQMFMLSACQILDCTREELLAVPENVSPVVDPDNIKREDIDAITTLFRDGIMMIHDDLRQILKELRPTVEPPKIGDEASK